MRLIQPGYRKLNPKFFRRSLVCGVVIEGFWVGLFFAFPGGAGGGFAGGSVIGYCILAIHAPVALPAAWLLGPAGGAACAVLALATFWTLLLWHVFTTWEAGRAAPQATSATDAAVEPTRRPMGSSETTDPRPD